MSRKKLPVFQPTAGDRPERAGSADAESKDLARAVLRVDGMDCANCALTIERRVGGVPGVERAVVNFAAGRLDADYAPETSLLEIETAVEEAGYSVIHEAGAETTPFWRTRRALLTLGSAFLFGAGALLGLSGAPEVVQAVVYGAAMLGGGFPIFRAAVAALRSRHMDMNALMSAAALGAFAIGAWGEAALVVVLFSAGNALQTYAVGRTRDAVRSLARLAPDEALVRREGAEVVVETGEIEAGELVVARPGERLAVDGEILEGRTTVDEAPVTGESVPIEKGPGERVYSGSLNGAGGIVIRAEKRAADSTLQRIARMVEEAQSSKAPAERFVDRFSRVYTPLVVAAAVALALAPPLLGGDFGTWFYRGLALLIIACPCSLVISTPVTVVSGIGAASRLGVLIKGGAVLETAGRLETLIFDKTGTLTEGRPVLSRIRSLGTLDDSEALRLAAALERRSEHPLAHAILTASEARGQSLPETASFTTTPGRGAMGRIEENEYLIGSPRLFEERGISLGRVRPALSEIEDSGETPVILGSSSEALAVFGLADAVRRDARATVAALRAAGIGGITMLTGDSDAPAKRVAESLGIDYRANLLPEQKVAAVRELSAKGGATGMVGDGVNDAPALAAASVGFAMGAAGTGVALETADVALMRDDLRKLEAAILLSRGAERIIKQNIAASIILKGAFVLLAPFGLVTLWLAVLADMGTSIAVILNGMRLFRARG